MAYGMDKPNYDDCGQDLAQLAPFVPTDDCFQLEDLDLRGMFPEVDFSEFFPAEQSPLSNGSSRSLEDKRNSPAFDMIYPPVNQFQSQEVPTNWTVEDNQLW